MAVTTSSGVDLPGIVAPSSRGLKLAVIAGTRPEIIKVAPVISAIDSRFGAGSALIIDTGQHYDHAMSGQFWSELGLPRPQVQLAGGGLSRAACIGYLTTSLGHLLSDHRPDALIVQGDTNSTLAGALAANAEGIKLVHVEAGLRSHDRSMPEEHNRIVIDHLADLCCAATSANETNLVAENISIDRIAVTGNTIVESVERQLPTLSVRVRTIGRFGLEVERYVLATIHRPENTDDPAALQTILRSLDGLAQRIPVLLALHPRTRAAIEGIGATDLLRRLIVTGPLSAREFLSLVAHAALIVSDSGGVAEEVTVLKRPLIVVRRSTERPESIDAGFALLVSPEAIDATSRAALDSNDSLLSRLRSTPSPYGDGDASRRIVALTSRLISDREATGV
jgi:UDP-N-acetylglucosamine 2-epimerase (non-hydrolysing)